MLRTALKLKNSSALPNITRTGRNQCVRRYTSENEKSSPAKVGLIVGSSVAVVTGATLGYAKYDQQFRKKIEDNIPYSNKLMDSLLGATAQKPDTKLQAISDSKDKSSESQSLMKKKSLETIPQLKANTSTKSVDKSSVDNKDNISNGSAKDSSKTSDKKSDTKDDKKEPEKGFSFGTNDNNIEDKNNNIPPPPSPDDSLQDIDFSIAKDKLTELLNILPDDDERVKELQKRCNDIELEYQRKITKLKEKFDKQSQIQLRRQLSAFNDHLTEQLAILRQQLKREYTNQMEEKLLEEHSRYQSDLSQSFYRLQLLEQLLKAREQLDNDQYEFRRLWVLCQSLREVLNYRSNLTDVEPVSLDKELAVINAILSKDSLKDRPIMKLALESIPKEVKDRGVYTESDLKRRFNTVDKYCRRVALIGDEGGSLYMYLLSYLQSVLVWDSKIPREELEGKEVDPSKWDTFDILTRVKHCLNNNNLEMALRYANQLKGEARNVAKDWIRDTRTHLELKQAVDVLQTEADAVNVQIIN